MTSRAHADATKWKLLRRLVLWSAALLPAVHLTLLVGLRVYLGMKPAATVGDHGQEGASALLILGILALPAVHVIFALLFVVLVLGSAGRSRGAKVSWVVAFAVAPYFSLPFYMARGEGRRQTARQTH